MWLEGINLCCRPKSSSSWAALSKNPWQKVGFAAASWTGSVVSITSSFLTSSVVSADSIWCWPSLFCLFPRESFFKKLCGPCEFWKWSLITGPVLSDHRCHHSVQTQRLNCVYWTCNKLRREGSIAGGFDEACGSRAGKAWWYFQSAQGFLHVERLRAGVWVDSFYNSHRVPPALWPNTMWQPPAVRGVSLLMRHPLGRAWICQWDLNIFFPLQSILLLIKVILINCPNIKYDLSSELDFALSGCTETMKLN